MFGVSGSLFVVFGGSRLLLSVGVVLLVFGRIRFLVFRLFSVDFVLVICVVIIVRLIEVMMNVVVKI